MGNKEILIIGKAPECKQRVVGLANELQTISVNNAYKYYAIQPTYVIMQDKYWDKENAKNIIKEGLKADRVYETYKNTKKPTFNKLDNKLCFYPYSGVAAIDFCYKKGYNKVILAGFSFGDNHDYYNKAQSRDQGTQNLYIRNVLLLSKHIKILTISPNGIGLDIYDS